MAEQMKENRYFKNRDIRAVENPYEASFELANYFRGFSRSMKLSITILMVFFAYYSIGIIAIIIFNLMYGTNFGLNVFSVAFSMFMLFLTFTAIRQLMRSHSFLKDLGSHQDLMLKIQDKADNGQYYKNEKVDLKIQGSPTEGLMGLIISTSKFSKKIARTFRLITGFISVWFLAGIFYLTIQFYRFGPDVSSWKLDWLLPGGIDLSISLLAVILIFLVHKKFDFFRIRYEFIEYAMNQPVEDIPKGQTPIERYKHFLTSKNGYKQFAGNEYWVKGDYFDAEFDGIKGRVFVKYLKKVPQKEDIQTFRERVINRAHKKPIDRAVIIFKEDPRSPLSDDTYTFLVDNPIELKREICAIQLVLEGMDGKYDFIPIISF
ncbi:MAG: hypothetical protein JSW28_00405 [Thermoplasmata archaeon]|nr:MAG: hypothetical protein JSW28_00405 [Thermoplasmata archaeon]